VRKNGLGEARWGFAVGKKLAKRAVVRNRVKRRFKELAREMDVRDGVDLVVTARGGALACSYSEMRERMSNLLARAGVQRGGVQE